MNRNLPDGRTIFSVSVEDAKLTDCRASVGEPTLMLSGPGHERLVRLFIQFNLLLFSIREMFPHFLFLVRTNSCLYLLVPSFLSIDHFPPLAFTLPDTIFTGRPQPPSL